MHTDHVFLALAHPVRRSILRNLERRETRAGDIAEKFEISRPAISKHLSVLKRAGLVVERRNGRENIYGLNKAAATEARAWLNAFWEDRLMSLKRLAEDEYDKP